MIYTIRQFLKFKTKKDTNLKNVKFSQVFFFFHLWNATPFFMKMIPVRPAHHGGDRILFTGRFSTLPEWELPEFKERKGTK
jgi:hypothetical protein